MVRIFVGFMFLVFAPQVLGKQEINILFVGKTQTGKSSLINIFYNHIIGKRFEDERAIIIPLLDGDDQLLVNVEEYKAYGVELRALNQSQTSRVLRYTAENENYVVHLWDAPGFNDTNQEVSDEEIAERIANAVKGIYFNTIAIVLKPNEPVSFDMRANISRIKTILPKNAQQNIVGIYTRAPNLSKGVKQAGVQGLRDVLNFPQGSPDPNVHFIDGTSFFDDEAYDGNARWSVDANAVQGVLLDAVRCNPFDATAMFTIQHNLNMGRGKFQELKDLLWQYEQLKHKQIEATNALNDAEKKRDENKQYPRRRMLAKKGCTRFGPRIAEWGGRRLRHDFEPDIEFQVDFDEAKMQRYNACEKDVQRFQNEVRALKHEEEALKLRQSEIMEYLQELKRNWASMALSTNVDSFIEYIEREIRFAQRTASYDETTRSKKVESHLAKKSFYEFMRDL